MTDHSKTVVGRFVWIGWAIVLSIVVVVLSSSAVNQQDRTAEVLRQSNADLSQALASLHEAKESLKEAKEIIGMSPGCTVICNEQGIIKRISEDADEIFGWPASELVGGSITKIMDELTAQKHATAFAEQVKAIKSLGPKFILRGVDSFGRTQKIFLRANSAKIPKVRHFVRCRHLHTLLVAFTTGTQSSTRYSLASRGSLSCGSNTIRRSGHQTTACCPPSISHDSTINSPGSVLSAYSHSSSRTSP